MKSLPLALRSRPFFRTLVWSTPESGGFCFKSRRNLILFGGPVVHSVAHRRHGVRQPMINTLPTNPEIPKLKTPQPKTQAQNPVSISQNPNPKSHIPHPKSQIPDPKTQVRSIASRFGCSLIRLVQLKKQRVAPAPTPPALCFLLLLFYSDILVDVQSRLVMQSSGCEWLYTLQGGCRLDWLYRLEWVCSFLGKF